MTDEEHPTFDHDAETSDTPPDPLSDSSTFRDIPPPQPKKIGHYAIKQHIGSGGMAHVYLALQEHPRRKVALKLMKKGIASRSALRRFEFESQILGRLRHPNIAQVYEAGTYDEGEGGIPYFAMEYIANAKPITDYAKEKKLSTKERLELFTKVCDAVHHGHQKGIIHRDLKPGNILVDSYGEPKVIDFGVARSTDSDMAVTTLQTDVGQLIGTLQYMSPEQCEADPEDLDTRSDVYALGVVLYELLCGQLPYNVTKVAMFEAARVVKEEKPAKPSTINRTLRGDVETIALKALEKERERRYKSAEALGDDIHKYLSSEPIEARPPSIFYQIRMFARRNRVLTTASTLVFIVLILSTTISLIYYAQAIEAKNILAQEVIQRQQSEEAALIAKAEAERSATRARQQYKNAQSTHDLLLGIIIRVDNLPEILDIFVASAKAMQDRQGDNNPELSELLARLMNSIGFNLIMNENYHEAVPLLKFAVQNNPKIHAFHKNLITALERAQRFKEAESILLNAVSTDDSDWEACFINGKEINIREDFISHAVYFYDTWDEAEPGHGYDAKADEWRKLLPTESNEQESN